MTRLELDPQLALDPRAAPMRVTARLSYPSSLFRSNDRCDGIRNRERRPSSEVTELLPCPSARVRYDDRYNEVCSNHGSDELAWRGPWCPSALRSNRANEVR